MTIRSEVAYPCDEVTLVLSIAGNALCTVVPHSVTEVPDGYEQDVLINEIKESSFANLSCIRRLRIVGSVMCLQVVKPEL